MTYRAFVEFIVLLMVSAFVLPFVSPHGTIVGECIIAALAIIALWRVNLPRE